jgi:phage tail protein X
MAATKYTTRQGQTVDMVCMAHYGRTDSVTELVLDVNPGVGAIGPILPTGKVLMLPAIETKPKARELIDLWV